MAVARQIDRRGIQATAGWAALAAGLAAAAMVTASTLERLPSLAAAVPAAVISGVLCARFPMAALATLVALTATFGSITAFLDVPVQQGVDVLLVGLWAALLWRLAFGGRTRRFALTPASVALLLFAGVSAFQILTAIDLETGLRAFRSSGWYVAAFALVALPRWPDGALQRLARGVLVVALLVAAYAVLREIIGPADAERELALKEPFNVRDEELSLVGSFGSRHQLGAWFGILIPFCAALALVLGRRGRLAALAIGILGTIGIFGAEVRVGIVGVALGLGVVLLLAQFSRAFPLRLEATALAVAVGLLGGFAALSLTIGTSGEEAQRYTVILTPGEDPAFQARQRKWKEAMREISKQPMGHGLGSAGGLARPKFTQFTTIASFDLDNSFLKVGYEQGIGPMILLCAAFLLLLHQLARTALFSAVPERAALAAGAAAALVAFSAILFTQTSLEGYTALVAFILLGLGAAQATVARTPDR